MDDSFSIVDRFINRLRSKLIDQLFYDENGELRLIDPNDKVEVSAHYGATHLAASLLLLSKETGDTETKRIGKKILSGILKRWEKENLLPAYHYDFNNFAFIICYDCLEIEDVALKDLIKEIVLKSPDSNHSTINWLPMRAIVNNKRYQWTGNVKYVKNIKDICKKIDEATNKDGGIEDRLPKGVSFNLQYDISTIATMILAKEIFPDYDFQSGICFLLENIAPDGDINYQGRGCNQIFAWGPWIYILASYGLVCELDKALSFLNPLVDKMLDNNSMMLNYWLGEEKYLWWDYHYSSVYTAHFLLWILLAKRDFKRYTSEFSEKKHHDNLTNLRIYKSQNFCVSVFGGRNEYLAERGPSISLLWLKNYGNIVKGCLGPWRGLFGNKNTFEDVVLLNYCGLIKEKRDERSTLINKIIRNIRPLQEGKVRFEKSPNFCPIQVIEENERLSIIWSNDHKDLCYFNLPSLCDSPNLQLTVDGIEMPIYKIARIRNQYDWVNIFQSKAADGERWVVTFYNI